VNLSRIRLSTPSRFTRQIQDPRQLDAKNLLDEFESKVKATTATRRSLDAYVVVQTCVGREQDLSQTLHSIAASDLGLSVRVLMDREAIEDLGLEEKDKYERIGAGNRFALREFLGTPHEFLLFMEDDVDLNPHLRHNIETWPAFIAGVDLASFFYSKAVYALRRCDTLVFADAKRMFGAQCLLISRKGAEATLAAWGNHDAKYRILDRQAPENIFFELRSPICVHEPGLVHHRAFNRSAWVGHSKISDKMDVAAYEVLERSLDLDFRRELPSSAGKIRVLTMCTRDWSELGAMTIPPMLKWCLRHGYDLTVITAPRIEHTINRCGGKREPPWPKVQEIIDHLPGCDWLVWLDSDIIIRNPEFTLNKLLNTDKDFVLAQFPTLTGLEPGGEICIGSMALKNTPATMKFLQEWLITPCPARRMDVLDQGPVNDFVAQNRVIPPTKFVGEGEFADYNWHDRGSPMVHFCMGGLEEKTYRIRRFVETGDVGPQRAGG